jgi:hypothetical protein
MENQEAKGNLGHRDLMVYQDKREVVGQWDQKVHRA